MPGRFGWSVYVVIHSMPWLWAEVRGVRVEDFSQTVCQ